MIFDTHTHAYFDSLKIREDDILSNMSERGVAFAVQIGCDAKTSREAVELAKRHLVAYRATVGLHPTEAQEMDEYHLASELGELESVFLANRETVVAVGETGWDFHHLSSDPEIADIQKIRQKLALEAQISLAKRHALPLVIHTRDSADALLETLRKERPERFVLHCYSENATFAQIVSDEFSGAMFGFSGILTYKNATSVQEAAKALPIDRILLETDAPFLAPQAVRGTVNESANTRYVLECLAFLRNEPVEAVERAIWENSMRFYGIETSDIRS